MQCPKCGAERNAVDLQCPACGVYYAKVTAALEKKEQDKQQRKAMFEEESLNVTEVDDSFFMTMSKSTKRLIGIAVIVVGLAGSLGYFYLNKYFFSEVVTSVALQEKNGLFYLPDKEKPFTGKHQFYVDGQLQVTRTFKDGKEDGLLTLWYKNGQKKTEFNFKDGKEDGLITLWYENGQKKLEGNVTDRKPDGLITSWYDNAIVRTVF